MGFLGMRGRETNASLRRNTIDAKGTVKKISGST